LSCCRTLLSSGVVASGQPRKSMVAAAKFYDARLKSGGPSPSTLASSSTRWLSSHVWVRVGGVGVRALERGVLAVLLPLVVPSTVLFPHRDLLRVWLRVAWPLLPEF
jgi:hypothetical protein